MGRAHAQHLALEFRHQEHGPLVGEQCLHPLPLDFGLKAKILFQGKEFAEQGRQVSDVPCFGLTDGDVGAGHESSVGIRC